MSELQVTTVSVNNTTNATAIVVGDSVINSTGIHLGSGGGVNTSAISVDSEAYVLTANMNIPAITIGNVVTTGIFETVNVQIFTANGTWTKPSWATDGKELVVVHLWGGGGGASFVSGISASGGGGGAHVFGNFMSSQVNAVCNVVVGAGGSIGANGASGTSGENSIFFSNATNSLVAYGGAAGFGNTVTTRGGSGGGWISAGVINGNGGGPLGGTSSNSTSTFGGAAGANSSFANGGSSIYGGGGGGTNLGVGGRSIFGGAGGAFEGAVATSVYGGNGGNNSVAATAPGGGGGTSSPSTGARGEVRIYTYRILS